jgi:uncharacterized protein (TIGR02270 family)
MTAPPTLTYIPDIVEEHYDELQFLWTQRRAALRSPAYTERELRLLDERIDAHADGMLVIGERLVAFVEPALAADEPMPAFAAAFALLRLGTTDALARVIAAFATANGAKLDGLRDALAHGPSKALAPQLTSLWLSGPPRVGAAAAEVLAFQAAINPAAQDLERFVRAEEPATRAAGWRIATYCGVSMPSAAVHVALSDDDPEVKRCALIAAAWNASPEFLTYCRTLAAQPAPGVIDALTLFAAVASPEEYQLIGAVASHAEAGPHRFRVIGAFAHPYFVDLLIAEMANPNPAVAAAAAAAFEKMTGASVESDNRATIPSRNAPGDEFDKEFEDDVLLPDPALARKLWNELAPRLAHSPRIARGIDLSGGLSREGFAALDMESRWEHCLRARVTAGWPGTPVALERFPQRG